MPPVVIMPDHVHLLLWPRSPVPGILRSIKQSVARRAVRWAKAERPETLKRMRDPRGVHRFWQRGGGFDRNIWEPEPIWKAIDDIHMNPVKAGLCEHPDDWPWSSAAHVMGRGDSPVPLDTDTIPPRPSHL